MPSEKEHINWKAIKDYHNGKLTGLEENRIERLAEKDPFFKDALEGYSDRMDQSEIQSDLKDIEKMVHHRSGQSSFDVSSYRLVGLAASLVILVSASLWIWTSLNNTPTKLADKTEETSEEIFDYQEEKVEKENPELEIIEEEIIEESVEEVIPIEEEPQIQELIASKKPDSGAGMNMLAMESGAAYTEEEDSSVLEEDLLMENVQSAPMTSSQNELNELIDSILMIDNAFVVNIENTMAMNSSPARSMADSGPSEEEPKERKKRKSIFNRKDARKSSDEMSGASGEELDLLADQHVEIDQNAELKKAMTAIKEGRNEDAKAILTKFEARNPDQKRLLERLLKLIE